MCLFLSLWCYGDGLWWWRCGLLAEELICRCNSFRSIETCSESRNRRWDLHRRTHSITTERFEVRTSTAVPSNISTSNKNSSIMAYNVRKGAPSYYQRRVRLHIKKGLILSCKIPKEQIVTFPLSSTSIYIQLIIISFFIFWNRVHSVVH